MAYKVIHLLLPWSTLCKLLSETVKQSCTLKYVYYTFHYNHFNDQNYSMKQLYLWLHKWLNSKMDMVATRWLLSMQNIHPPSSPLGGTQGLNFRRNYCSSCYFNHHTHCQKCDKYATLILIIHDLCRRFIMRTNQQAHMKICEFITPLINSHIFKCTCWFYSHYATLIFIQQHPPIFQYQHFLYLNQCLSEFYWKILCPIRSYFLSHNKQQFFEFLSTSLFRINLVQLTLHICKGRVKFTMEQAMKVS